MCEFALKRDNKIICMCSNLGRAFIDGRPTNIRSQFCEENKFCYYKLWKRSLMCK